MRNLNPWLVLLLVVVITVLSLYSMRPGHPWSGDFSMYLMQKDSIVSGDTSHVLNLSAFRNDNSTKIVGPQVYPWGYPVALYFMSNILGDDVELFKNANVILMGVFLILVYLYFKNSMSSFSMVMMLLVLGLSPGFFEVKNAVLSDMLAVVFSFLSLVAVQAVVGLSSGWKYVAGVVCGLSMFAAFFTRTQYIILPAIVAVVVGFDVVSKRRRERGISVFRKVEFRHVLPFVVFSVLTLAGRFAVSVHSTYDNHFAGYNYLLVAVKNVAYYAYAFSLSWGVVNIDPDLFKLTGVLRLIVSAVLFLYFSPALVRGVVAGYGKNKQAIVIALLGMAIPIFYPWQCGLRLVVFVAPFYLWFVLVGIEHLSISRAWSMYARVSKFVLIAMACFVVFSNVYKATLCAREGYAVGDGPYSASSKELWEYINNYTDANATFAFWDPRILNLFTGRKSVSYLQISDVNPTRIDYVVLAREGDVLSCASCRECYDVHEKVFSNGRFVVCKTNPLR